MGFSELEFLKDETGLDWDGEKLCLSGVLKDYPLFVFDRADKREYAVVLFCKVRPDVEDRFKKGITELLSAMPKNCVAGRTDEVRYTSVRFNAALLYQENSIYLARFAEGLCGLAESLDLVPVTPDQKEREIFARQETANSPQKNDQKKPVKSSKNAVLKGFDKNSLKGLFGAVVGGAAMTVIAAIVTANDPSNVGAMIAGWAAGALIAAVVLADYRFFAKKIDIFGSVVCSLITAVCCFTAADLGTLRALYLAMRTIDFSATLNSTMANWSYYAVLFPEVTDRFPLMLIQNFLSAIAASVLFFTLYFRKFQGVMFGRGREVLDIEPDKKKKKIR
ncbi:MAG: hypothetical protein K2N36_01235 [Ruminiclostridium sp.]|nr:hypothetical protein [Ruminiclostridium sp.]